MARSSTVPLAHPESFFIGGSWVAPSSDCDHRRHRRRHRGARVQRRRGAGRRHGPRGRGRPHRVRRGAVAAADPRRARRVPPRPRRGADGAQRRARRRVAARVGRPASMAQYSGTMAAERVRRRTRRWPTPSRSEEQAQPSGRPASASSCASRSVWSARSSRGTRRSSCITHKIGPGAARGLLDRAEALARGARARATCSPRPPSRSGSRPACSTSSPPTARCRSCSSPTRASTRSPSPVPPPPAARSRRSAVSASRASRSSSAASRRRWCSTTPTSRKVAGSIAGAECLMTGQVCSSLTRIVVTQKTPRRDGRGAGRRASPRCRWATSSTTTSQMGPLAMRRQRDRVEGYIQKGVDEGATLAAGGGRPKHLERGWFVEPTVFGNVDNSSTIAQEEIFGPVLSVIPAADEQDADPHRQRHHLRPQLLGVHPRRRPRLAGGRAAPLRHRGAQRLQDRLRHRLRRVQAVGHRS